MKLRPEKIAEIKELILERMKSLTESDIKFGKGWYWTANRAAAEIAEASGLLFSQVVGIIAVLSPSNKWNDNLVDAMQIACGDFEHKARTYGTNKKKAIRIATLDINSLDIPVYVAVREIVFGVSGWKTAAFYDNILTPTISGSVCIDRHMVRSIGWSYDKAPKGRVYKEIEAAFVQVSLETCKFSDANPLHMIAPHELQAAIWVNQRGEAY